MKIYPPFLSFKIKLLSRSFQTKKNVSKNIDFWRSYEFLKMAYFGRPKNGPPKIFWAVTSSGGKWKNGRFCRSDIPIEIDFNQKVLIPVKYLLDLFLCKIGRWIQKNGFRDLKLITSSGMTSLISN